MPLQTPRRVSVSTWSLHPLLGTCAPGRPGDTDARMMADKPGTLDLLKVPAALAAQGFSTMELCHFHIPSREPHYLQRLRETIKEADVELWNLLIDDGDIVHPEHGDRDREWILGWIDTAAELGAKCVRVIGGKQEPTPENVARSREQLLHLTVDGYTRGVRVMTENWFSTLSRPEHVAAVCGEAQNAVGLCLDFGNWGGATKYDDLAEIAPFAESCHAKCHFTDGKPDSTDYERCLALLTDAGYQGPFTLVHGEAADVWGSLDVQRRLVTPYL
jgi:sugar phosphate isomerase/epimerase